MERRPTLATPGSPLLYVFAIFYGGGMGIKTIVQATAGPEFLGREGYGALQGTFAGINFARRSRSLCCGRSWAAMTR
jgi:hypothetical protein